MDYKDPRATTALPNIDSKKEDEALRSGDLNASGEPDSPKKFLILVVDDSADNVALLSWIFNNRVIGW
jgi:hypothetical protein